MEYKVTIDNFEGPLDLLLHLIKEDNLNIEDIKIEDITKEYLDYIKAMQDINLDIASEYLVMAAELIEMKSRILLPDPVTEDDTYEEDPREELINRLLEYKRYKEVKDEFKELEETRKEYYTKLPEDLSAYDDHDLDLGGIDINDLAEAFAKFMQKKVDEKPLNTKITTKEYSIAERSREIKDILKKKKKVSFEELFVSFKKDYVIVTFLAILDLASKQNLVIKQENNFDKIYLEEE